MENDYGNDNSDEGNLTILSIIDQVGQPVVSRLINRLFSWNCPHRPNQRKTLTECECDRVMNNRSTEQILLPVLATSYAYVVIGSRNCVTTPRTTPSPIGRQWRVSPPTPHALLHSITLFNVKPCLHGRISVVFLGLHWQLKIKLSYVCNFWA